MRDNATIIVLTHKVLCIRGQMVLNEIREWLHAWWKAVWERKLQFIAM